MLYNTNFKFYQQAFQDMFIYMSNLIFNNEKKQKNSSFLYLN